MMKNCSVVSKSDGHIDGYEALANAIIFQAVKDYRAWYRAYIRHPNNGAAINNIEELRRFFLGGWFQGLTDLDGKAILDHIEKEVEHEYKRKFNRQNKS